MIKETTIKMIRDALIKFDEIIISVQPDKELYEAMLAQNYYVPEKCESESYAFINKMYGFKPIFGFKIKSSITDERIKELFCHIPSYVDSCLVIMKGNTPVMFSGEYYNWCDIHGLINNQIGRAPASFKCIEIDYNISRKIRNVFKFDEEWISKISSKEGFEAWLNQKPYNLEIAEQVIMNRINQDDILSVCISVFNYGGEASNEI